MLLPPEQLAGKIAEIATQGFCILDGPAAVWPAGWIEQCHGAFLDVLTHFAAKTEPNRGANRYCAPSPWPLILSPL